MAKRGSSGSSPGRSTKQPKQVRAAGGVVWRTVDGQREVLLVHRPRYDDWSIPKGKLHGGEPAPVAAVREVLEETGVRVRLGRELRTLHYQVDGAPKSVRYWLADPVEETRFEPNDEVDELGWFGLKEAGSRVRETEHALLRSALKHATTAAPLVVVRHGYSVRRKEWSDDDRLRPLSAEGREQAGRLVGLLSSWGPTRVVTSPSTRCRDTVAPFATASGIQLELEDGLSEEAFEADPRPARDLVRSLLAADEPVVLCTHRPLLATVAKLVGLDLPKHARANPLPKGGIWVAHPNPHGGVERHTS